MIMLRSLSCILFLVGLARHSELVQTKSKDLSNNELSSSPSLSSLLSYWVQTSRKGSRGTSSLSELNQILVDSQAGGDNANLDSANVTRKIIRKSIFFAPSLIKCPEGYRPDTLDRCVKDVEMNHNMQLDFLLKRISTKFFQKLGINTQGLDLFHKIWMIEECVFIVCFTCKNLKSPRPSPPELIEHHGYIPETHYIWTEDDYCLTVHRIIGPKTSNVQLTNSNVTSNTEQTITDDLEKSTILNLDKSTLIDKPESIYPENKLLSRPPVIVNHGVLSSSADWVLLGPQKALAYTLCQAGYDVWLPNVRGNLYSKKHKVYTPKNKEFWDFSFHEVGYYDIPAIIDYVLEKTAHSELSYIGYSQGTTAFYVMGCERPEYNAKVKVMISLAPIAFLDNQQSPLLKLAVHFCNLMEWGSLYCNINQWFPHSKLQARAVSMIIRNAPNALTKTFCNSFFHIIAGFGSNQLEKNMFPLIFGHFPAGASVKQITHYSQAIVTGSFRKFDYGIRENFQKYGSTQPPKYSLEKIKVPVAIFYGENDFLTHSLDVQKIIDKLPNVIEAKKIEYSKFNHVDFLWGRDAKTLVYNRVVAVLKRF
ncbi:hypothetical protein M0802_009249 [Mischocyttarus mexicanus]|nr:hypothetical protein M0802_009249 [Mischocyttarus mexicanus]